MWKGKLAYCITGMKPRSQHLTGDQGARTPPAGSPAPGLWPTRCCQGAQGASSSPGTWTGRASGEAASTQSSAGQLPLITYKNETLCWLVTYHNEALSLVLCYNEAPSLVKISCFREHFKNIFSIGYEERRGRGWDLRSFVSVLRWCGSLPAQPQFALFNGEFSTLARSRG